MKSLPSYNSSPPRKVPTLRAWNSPSMAAWRKSDPKRSWACGAKEGIGVMIITPIPSLAPHAQDRFGSDLRHAAIDGEFHARNVGTFRGGEELYDGSDFIGLASSAERNLRGESRYCLFHHFRGNARFFKSRG